MRRALAALGRLLGRRCHGCGAVAVGEGPGALPPLCAECARELAGWSGPCCPGCGGMFPGKTGEGDYLCSACRLEPRPWERLYFFGAYEGLLRSLILDWKFEGGLGSGRLLGGLAREAWRRGAGPQAPEAPEVLVPVPLHPLRLRWRGFNQSLELARALARETGAEVLPGGLSRVRHTVPQTTLGAGERRANVRGAFAADAAALRGRRVLLVDDVMTTGTTLEECARTLRRAGAARVLVLVLARTGGSG